jgi:hypothetical protein
MTISRIGAAIGATSSVTIPTHQAGDLLLIVQGERYWRVDGAAMKLLYEGTLPQANAALSITAALGITFPFNLAIGIPIYFAFAAWLGA